MTRFRYFVSSHALILVVIHVSAQSLVSALTFGQTLQADPHGWEEAVLDPEGDSPLLRSAAANGSARQAGPWSSRGWEEAVLVPEGDGPLLRHSTNHTIEYNATRNKSYEGGPSKANFSDYAGTPGHSADSRMSKRTNPGFPWLLVVILVLVCVLNGLLCCAFQESQTEGLPHTERRSPEWPRAKGSQSSLGTSVVSDMRQKRFSSGWSAYHSSAYQSSAVQESRLSSDTECRSETTIEDSHYGMVEESALLEAKDIVLCPLLLVPASNRCVCLVNLSASAEKQDIALPVRGIGGACLFRININERSGSLSPRIQVETTAGDELAYICTEPLWRDGSARPQPLQEADGAPAGRYLRICWPSGRPFGCLRKAGGKAYAVQLDGCEQDVLSFVGDFNHFNLSVNTLGMQSVASVTNVSSRECRATVRAHCDAGLVLLVLVAIEKCEALVRREGVLSAKKGPSPVESAPTTATGSESRGSTTGGSSSDLKFIGDAAGDGQKAYKAS